MARPKRSETEREAFRIEVRKTARKLFLRDGPDGLSMRKIARELGCSATTLYAYFDNRNEIIRSFLRATTQELAQTFEDLRARETDPLERIRGMLLAYVRLSIEKPEEFQVAFLMMPERIDDLPEPEVSNLCAAPTFRIMHDTLREAMESGQIARRDPYLTAQALWAAVHGTVALRINLAGVGFAEQERLTREAVDLALGGLASPSVVREPA